MVSAVAKQAKALPTTWASHLVTALGPRYFLSDPAPCTHVGEFDGAPGEGPTLAVPAMGSGATEGRFLSLQKLFQINTSLGESESSSLR